MFKREGTVIAKMGMFLVRAHGTCQEHRIAEFLPIVLVPEFLRISKYSENYIIGTKSYQVLPHSRVDYTTLTE